MELLRRAFLLSGSGLVLASHPAYAILFSGSPVSGGGGGLLTTMTLLNTSGSTQAIGSCTQIFGHPFKKGDMPSGQYPVFKTTSGTVIPYSISSKTKTWSDGSMKHASFMLRLPVTIAASPGSLTVNIYSGGTVPSASSRATSDFTSGGLDLNVFVTGQDQLFGDWTSNLSQGITAALSDNYIFMDGDAGKVWRIRANFRQSGADHGQLEGWWYVQALTDASGTLGGIRHLTRVIQPLYNQSTPATQYRSLSAFKTRNATTTLVDLMTRMPAPINFTYSGGISGVPQAMNSVGNNCESCIACKLTTTGTLPGGLDGTTLYAISHGSLSNGNPDPDTLGISLDFGDVSGRGMAACITPSSNGSGIQTATFYPMISSLGSFYTANVDGRYNYIQGAGSLASDSTIVCQMNAAYWCRTQCLPPFALGSYSVASNATLTYFPGTAGPVSRNTAATGEREDIGTINSWYSRHIFTQSTTDDRAVRVIGLVGGHLPVALYDLTTRSIPVGNNGHANNGVTYSGMPAVNINLRWLGNGNNSNGLTLPTLTNYLNQGWTGTDTSHLPNLAYYPYLLTGEPQYKDQIAEYGSNALCSQYTNGDTAIVDATHNTIGGVRNATINGVSYHGIFSGESGVRTCAWAVRDIGVCGIANFENASWNTYFADILSDIGNGMATYRGMLVAGANSYVTTNGMWDEGAGNNGGMWGLGYMIGAFTMAAGITESSTILDQANYMVKWPQHVGLVMGTWPVGCYRQTIRQGPSGNSLYSASDDQIGFWAWGVSWDSGTQLFTLTGNPNGYTIGNDDIFVWNPSEGGNPPAGMNSWQGYHVINWNSGTSNFQLSLTQGGSAITLSDTGSAGLYGQPTLAHNPSTGAIDNTGASGYHANVTGVSSYLKAIGGTVNSTYVTNMATRLQTFSGITSGFNTDPKYAMQATYV